ncbi:O-methyltransferase [Anaerolineales bacterium]
MSFQYPQQELNQYVNELFAEDDEALLYARQIAIDEQLGFGSIQPFEGKCLYMLAKAAQAKQIIEIGTLSGYSAIWLARALGKDGQLWTVDMDARHTKAARKVLEKAGLIDKVKLIIGDGIDMLNPLIDHRPFDMLFIDADRPRYEAYLDWASVHLRSGGIFVAHNAYNHGKVLAGDPEFDATMDAFNRRLAKHPAFDSHIIGIGDAFAVGIKK